MRKFDYIEIIQKETERMFPKEDLKSCLTSAAYSNIVADCNKGEPTYLGDDMWLYPDGTMGEL